MAWIDDEAGSQSNDTGFHPGRALYWLGTIIAAIMVMFVIADAFISWAQGGTPTVRVVALIAAAMVWLIGRICRALLP